MKMNKIYIYLFTVLPFFMACGYEIPTKFSESNELPNIYPDYANVTVPINI